MTETVNKFDSPLLNATDVFIRRIETTAKTDPEVFEECQRYIGAVHYLTNKVKFSSSHDEILRCQLLANELAKAMPQMLKNVEEEYWKLTNGNQHITIEKKDE